MTVVTPGRCGLYETTRELVAGLRDLGVDSRLVDPTIDKNKLYPKDTDNDRGAVLADMDWAVGADVIVNHSGYDNTPIAETSQPVIHIAHGRPRSSFLSEVNGSTPIYSYWHNKNLDPRFAAIVTFWPEHKPYLEVMFPGKPVHVVQAPCDSTKWNYDGPKGYGFHGKKGKVNIVIADHFANDIDQFVPLNAAALFAREEEDVKVHFYARPQKKGFDALLTRIKQDGHLGELVGWISGLENVYRAATMVLTANEIDTRTVREASCCGCPVVQISNLKDGWQVPLRKAMRMTQEDRMVLATLSRTKFSPKRSAEQFKIVLEKVQS